MRAPICCRILLWHEILNDTVGGVPVDVSYCPLCNSAIVFDCRFGKRTLVFGNTGRLRHYDMLMYGHDTESWWQQFLGEAVMGKLIGGGLKTVPPRLELLGQVRTRLPYRKILVPRTPTAQTSVTTPYVRMDTRADELAYDLPKGVRSFERVVVVGDRAWTLTLISKRRRLEADELILTWIAGQNFIHDAKWIAFGRDVGSVTVFQSTNIGLEEVP